MNKIDEEAIAPKLLCLVPVALLTLAGLSACQQPAAPPADLSSIEARLDSLEAGASGADVAHDGFSAGLEGIEARLSALEAKANGQAALRDFAGFRPTDEGYATIQTNVAPLVVSFNGVEALGNGTKLLLNVGNMTTAGFSGAEVSVQYIRAKKEGSNQPPGPFTATSRFTGTIRPGSWTVVAVPLSEVRPDELYYVTVSIKLDVLQLR